ncbi:MAG: hypothetical protein LBT21_07505 [Oscillospiraceae bacterium]|jgi:hypothetical protein|nr:hypothetical protein [Oscillospiraceae bacterium]
MKQWYYKIITAVISLGVIPVLLLLPIMKMQVAVSVVSVDFAPTVNANWIFHFAKDKETGNATLDNYLNTLDGVFDGAKLWENLGDIRARVIIFAAAIAICVLIALAIIALVFVLKQKRSKLWILALSGAGLLSAITASAAFSSIAAPLLDGRMALGDLLGVGSLISGFINLQALSMGSAVPVILLLFVLLLLVVTVFMVLDLRDDSSPKKRKKAKKKTVKR